MVRAQAKARLSPTTTKTTSRALKRARPISRTTRTSVGNAEKEPISKDRNAHQLIRSVNSARERDIMSCYAERRNLLYTRLVLNQVQPQWLSTPMKMAQSPTPYPPHWHGEYCQSHHATGN